MKRNRKCRCGENHAITCATCSKVKMVILLKTGNKELKYIGRNNRFFNPVWYSPISKNNKPVQLIINRMYKRFEKSKYMGVTNKVMFYDNYTKSLIVSM